VTNYFVELLNLKLSSIESMKSLISKIYGNLKVAQRDDETYLPVSSTMLG